MKPAWSSLDLTSLSPPQIPAVYRRDVPTVLSFICSCLKPENADLLPRGDYKEFLALAKIFLGGEVERKNGITYTIQRPGADSHARWMSKAIYTLKLTLLLHQFPNIPWYRKKKLEKMSLFIIFVYLQSWFTSYLLYSAASSDLDLYKRLEKFAKIHKKLSTVGAKVLQRHTWYLSEELIPISLFDPNLPDVVTDVDSIAQKISRLPDGDLPIEKPTLPRIGKTSVITDFVGPRSTVLFKLIDVPHSILSQPDWRHQPGVIRVREALQNQSTTYDSCERALSLATSFSGKITKDKSQYQDLVLLAESHRKKYKLEKKEDFKKLF